MNARLRCLDVVSTYRQEGSHHNQTDSGRVRRLVCPSTHSLKPKDFVSWARDIDRQTMRLLFWSQMRTALIARKAGVVIVPVQRVHSRP